MRRTSRLVALALLGATVGCGVVGCSEAKPSRQAPPLIVLVSLDTLRADHVSAYGYERNTTPHLDALAAESVLFERALAQASNTLISHKSILTGKQPLRLVHDMTRATEDLLRNYTQQTPFVVSALKKAPATLAPSLRELGYSTAAFTDGVWMTAEFGFDAGFDQFVAEKHAGLAVTGPKALGWVESLGDARGFLFLHTYDIHCPYTPPEPFQSLFCKNHASHVSLEGQCPKNTLEAQPLTERDLTAIRDHYDGGIVYADDQFGRLLDDLRAAGRWDETLLIVTSDHGEGLGENGQIGHGGLYPPQLFVPLLIKFPASWKIEPRRVPDLVELTDLVPTLLEIVGLPAPTDLDGRSLLPAATGTRGHRRGMAQIAFNEFQGDQRWESNLVKRAIYDSDGWFFLVDGRADTEVLERLVGRRSTGVAENAAVVADLRRTLAERESLGSNGEFSQPAELILGAETLEQLRELGYLGEDETALSDH